MPQNKYELRSTEVQEVMNKPPHYLITWSNTIILVIIIGGIWLLSLIQFPNKINIPFKLNVSEKKIMLLTNTILPKAIKSNQPICLSFESYPIGSYGEICSIIDTINHFKNEDIIIINDLNETMLSNANKHITINNNQLGTAEITIGKKTILDMFKRKFSPLLAPISIFTADLPQEANNVNPLFTF